MTNLFDDCGRGALLRAWALFRENCAIRFWEWLRNYERPSGEAFLQEIEDKLAPKLHWRRI